MKKWLGFTVILVMTFVAGVAVNYYWWPNSHHSPKKLTQSKESRKILYWVAPMNPNYRRDKPGKSPMGMDLVPVYADQQAKADDKNAITISPAVESNLGVKTDTVKPMDLARVINTVGYVTVDENNIDHLHTYAEGWIRKLSVKTGGEFVQKGQLLLTLYSPVLNNAQEELLLALKSRNQPLIRAGKKKLLTLGMAQSQISELVATKRVVQQVKVYASRSGIVSRLNVREGKFVKPDTDLMTIEDLSPIWVIAEVFERQANWVQRGQPAMALLPYLPGKTWEGKVDYVYPQLDAKTHTLRVRLAFPNPDLTIKPRMYADIKIFSRTIKQALAVPRSSLIRTGSGDRVVVALGKGRFKVQSVRVGIESGNYYQVLSGVKAGDRVVTSAQFLIDSESNLKAGLNRIGQQRQDEVAGPKTFVGMGKIIKIDSDKRMLLLRHQSIAALNMPPMTMSLAVEDGVDLAAVKVGDHVHFVLVKQANGHYLLTKIHVMTMSP